MRIAHLLAALCLLLVGANLPAGAEATKLRIGSQYGLIYLPILVANEEGYFAKEAEALGLPKIEVSVHTFSGSTAISEAVLSNNVDLAAFGTPGLLIAWEKTRGPQRILGLASLGAHTHTLFTNKANYKSLADFTSDDKIACPAFSSPQAILLRIAAERTWGSSAKGDALLVSMPHPEALKAVLSGTISGYISSPPFTQILEHDNRVHGVLTSKAVFEGKQPSAVILGGTQAFVDANPKLTRAVLAALEDADKLIRENPARAAEIYLSVEKVKLSHEEVVQILTDGSITYDVVPHGIVAYGEFMKRLSLMRAPPQKWQEAFFPLVHERAGD